MESAYKVANLSSSPDLRIAYNEHVPPTMEQSKGTILLLHGFPQTSYQFRKVLPLLTAQEYRCIAPDYRGAGASSKPAGGFTKDVMASDMIALLDHLGIHEPVHVVGHDIGGMIAYDLASRHSSRVKSVVWGECPLPGTTTYARDRTENAVQQFHFIFHSVPDLPELLIGGKEREYILHFFRKLTYNLDAFTNADINYYARTYSEPGAMRCALEVYRAFEADAQRNLDWLRSNGKCSVPTLLLSGAYSRHKDEAMEMALEVTEAKQVDTAVVMEAGHYVAEENPVGFVDVVAAFLRKQR